MKPVTLEDMRHCWHCNSSMIHPEHDKVAQMKELQYEKNLGVIDNVCRACETKGFTLGFGKFRPESRRGNE